MARIRTIKPEFWQDEKLAPMASIERLVFLGLISMADDTGRILDSVKVVDAFIFPSTDESSRDALDALARAERIIRGVTASGQRIIQIAGWGKHQKVDHPNLKAALPEIVVREALEGVPEPIARDSSDARASTYDLRPATNDLRPASVGALSTVSGFTETSEWLPEEYRPDFEGHVRASRSPAAAIATVRMVKQEGQHPPAVVGSALRDMALQGAKVTAMTLHSFIRGLQQPAGRTKDGTVGKWEALHQEALRAEGKLPQ